jgi:hypothetical protein
MITMTNEQLEKIKLLDALFGALSLDQLKQFTESEQIIAILKGTNQNPEIFKRLIQEHDNQMMTVMQLQGDISTLRYDVQQLVRIVLKPYDSMSVSDAQTLKSKFSVY